MTSEMLILIVLVVLLVGALPNWSYSRSWGYGPTGILGIILVVLVVWLIMNSQEGRGVNNDVQDGIQEVGQDLKEMGRDVKDSVQDAAR